MKFAHKNTARFAAVLSVLSLISFSAPTQPRVDLSEGSLSVLGALALKYELKILDKPVHEVKLTSDFGFGYFVMNNLLVGASIPIDWTIYRNKAGRVGFKLFTSYFFDTGGVIFPYLGISATPGFQLAQELFRFSAGFDAGVLVSISESVAFDFGLKPEVDIKINSMDTWKVTVPAGFLGVRVFF